MSPADTLSTGLPVHLSAPNIDGLIRLVEAYKDAIGGNPERIAVAGYSERPGKIELTLVLTPADRCRMH